MVINKQDLQTHYFSIATQYYVSGRFAASAGLLPVGGNLFHHSVEMYLKGYLCVRVTRSQLKRLGHNLPEIWRKFKQEISDLSLDQFDQTISGLDKFETIRYPEKIAIQGMEAIISFDRPTLTGAPGRPTCLEPRYEIVVDEIDRLVKVIFEKSNLNPPFFTGGLNKDAATYLTRSNRQNFRK